jgi:hypothetical protein
MIVGVLLGCGSSVFHMRDDSSMGSVLALWSFP